MKDGYILESSRKEIEIVSFHEGVTVYFLCEISEEVGIDSIVFTFEGLDDDIVIPLEISIKRYTWTHLLISLGKDELALYIGKKRWGALRAPNAADTSRKYKYYHHV